MSSEVVQQTEVTRKPSVSLEQQLTDLVPGSVTPPPAVRSSAVMAVTAAAVAQTQRAMRVMAPAGCRVTGLAYALL